ncbi:hypothetical protein A7D21_27310 [Pseudomonas sp. AP19]|uniref:hypothetical protein n=1 Tax=Pseudomonas TaxID=286 RepID=UPI00084AFFB1|nr:hypothetical protein [Pseudomonas sp. AP19]OEC68248.1 hypothetical protein A7D21_27310 [Pseudomonas sp. AP19]
MSQTVAEAQAALDAAKAAYLEELRRDSERGEGSHNQERRREERQNELQEKVWQCEQALKAAMLRQAGAANSA